MYKKRSFYHFEAQKPVIRLFIAAIILSILVYLNLSYIPFWVFTPRLADSFDLAKNIVGVSSTASLLALGSIFVCTSLTVCFARTIYKKLGIYSNISSVFELIETMSLVKVCIWYVEENTSTPTEKEGE